MKRSFLLLLAALIMLVAYSCKETTDPENNNNDPQDPEVPEVPEGPVVSKGAYKHVVIVGVDGAGAFFKDTPTPRLDEIFAGQATTLRSKTSYPTISAQCWASLLHGVLPEFHGITNDISENQKDGIQYPVRSPYPSIFRVAREVHPEAKLASFVSWFAINNGIIEHNLGVEMGETKDVDPEIARMTVQYLSDNAPMLLFVHFGSPDVVGEKQGFGTEAQLKAISDLDTYIGWMKSCWMVILLFVLQAQVRLVE